MPPVIRKNLSEGLYIMLDENLGGGVSLQKNIESLPAAMRPRIMDARRAFERDVLITPVLAALERGNDLQRVAVLDAFDGSFFKGRSFARQPEAMIDVGNDREFGFLYQPDLSALEATFSQLLTAELPAKARRQALQLAGFFKLPGRTQSSSIQIAALAQALGSRIPQSARRRGPSSPTMISTRTAPKTTPSASPSSGRPWREPTRAGRRS